MILEDGKAKDKIKCCVLHIGESSNVIDVLMKTEQTLFA